MINVKNVSKSFSNKAVLKDVSLDIKQGDIFGIVGHSGAGKSTLLRCLNGLESYDEGSIKIMGKEIKTLSNDELRVLRKDLGMIFQNFNLVSRKNVYDNIALPLQMWSMAETKLSLSNIPGYFNERHLKKADIHERVMSLLKLVGLEDKVNSKIKQLSGGQKQRVGIARALALNPKILLCDEATSALDPKTTKSILQLLTEINKTLNITVILVTHQMEVVKEICNKAILLEGGEIKAYGNVSDLFLKPNEELETLMGEEALLPSEGVNIKIFFSKDVSQKSIITSMARELDLDFSIVWGRLEKFRDEVLGSLVINFPEDERDKIVEYLESKKITWEVI
jgi:D-methionine transport system ATP-binding protein